MDIVSKIAVEHLENNLTHPCVLVLSDGKVAWANAAARKIGISPGRNASDFFISEDVERALSGETPLVFLKKAPFTESSDLVPYFDSYPVYDGDRRVGIFLISPVSRMLVMFDNIGIGVFICDNKGNIILSNSVADKLLPNWVVNSKNLFHLLAEVGQNVNSYDEIVEALHKNHHIKISANISFGTSTKSLEFRIFTMENKYSDYVKYYAIIYDLSDSFAYTKRKMHILKQEFLERFSSNVFHKLNNQFLLIMADAGLIRRKLPPDLRTELGELIDKLEEHIMATSETVELLSLFVRVPRQTTHRVDILEYLEKYVNSWLEQYGQDITVSVELPDLYAPVVAYKSLLDKIFDAVLDNAVRSIWESGKAGKISISAEVIYPDEIFLANYPELSSVPHIRITVADTGCGIDKKIIDRVFEPFFSGWKKPSRGLGLSVALSSIRHHGGTIDIKSEEGVGTTVSLFFPMAEVSEKSFEAYRVPQKVHSPKTVLVIEDDEDVQSALVNMLDSLGYESIVASNAQEGVSLFGKVRPDAVILDMILKETGGEVVYRKIMEIDPSVPVIIATAYTQIETVEELIDAGVRYILQKPFTMGQLAIVLEKVFS